MTRWLSKNTQALRREVDAVQAIDAAVAAVGFEEGLLDDFEVHDAADQRAVNRLPRRHASLNRGVFAQRNLSSNVTRN